MLILDTLETTRYLQKSGIPPEQADALTEVLKKAQERSIENLATKEEFKHEIGLLRKDLEHEVSLLHKDMDLIRKDIALAVKTVVIAQGGLMITLSGLLLAYFEFRS